MQKAVKLIVHITRTVIIAMLEEMMKLFLPRLDEGGERNDEERLRGCAALDYYRHDSHLTAPMRRILNCLFLIYE